MNLEEVIEEFKKKPYMIKQGKGYLSRLLKCKPSDIIKARETVRNMPKNKIPRILIFDIETSPMKAYVWKLWKENIHLPQIIDDWFVIAWSAKWLYSTDIMGEVLKKDEILKEDDSRIVKGLWDLFNKADVIVAHNGDNFDIPRMNARFIINGLPPTTPYFSVDTCRVARKQFGFSSNKLDALATYFGFDHKLETDFNLWKSCMEGDEVSLQYMLKYNKQDVKLLEEVYLKLRPWIKGHPNCGNILSSSLPICSACGSEHLELIEGEYYFSANCQYPIYRCKDCGAISRGRKRIKKELELSSIYK